MGSEESSEEESKILVIFFDICIRDKSLVIPGETAFPTASPRWIEMVVGDDIQDRFGTGIHFVILNSYLPETRRNSIALSSVLVQVICWLAPVGVLLFQMIVSHSVMMLEELNFGNLKLAWLPGGTLRFTCKRSAWRCQSTSIKPYKVFKDALTSVKSSIKQGHTLKIWKPGPC